MTSPPLSETGPSPEADWTAEAVVWAWEKQRGFSVGGKGGACRKMLVELVDIALLSAARKAHLQDARAVCGGCADDVPREHVEAQGMYVAYWRHRPDPDDPDFDAPCHASEIWDALSLLPPRS